MEENNININSMPNNINSMPNEIIEFILNFLNINFILSFSFTCQHYYKLANNFLLMYIKKHCKNKRVKILFDHDEDACFFWTILNQGNYTKNINKRYLIERFMVFMKFTTSYINHDQVLKINKAINKCFVPFFDIDLGYFTQFVSLFGYVKDKVSFRKNLITNMLDNMCAGFIPRDLSMQKQLKNTGSFCFRFSTSILGCYVLSRIREDKLAEGLIYYDCKKKKYYLPKNKKCEYRSLLEFLEKRGKMLNCTTMIEYIHGICV